MACRSCGHDQLDLVVDLGEQAWCNDFLTPERVGSEPTYPLRLVICPKCELAQLDHTVPKETMFKDHTYLSGTTKTLAKHFLELATSQTTDYPISKDDLIVDIGGNDGTQLDQYRKLGFTNLLNVESADNIAAISQAKGIRTANTFFNDTFVAEWLDYRAEKAKIISASGVFFHLEELHSVIRGIVELLADDGIFLVQFMYFGDMLSKTSFDGIYHEHLCYYSLKSLQNLLEPYGLEVFDAQHSPIHGGSVVARICHKGAYKNTSDKTIFEGIDSVVCSANVVREFAKNVSEFKSRLKSICDGIKDDGDHIIAVGAPAKGNTLLTYVGLDNKYIDVVYEANDLKIGRVTPVTHIPIVEEDKTFKANTYYLLLSWNFADEIMAKYPKGSKFILPFPVPRVVS